MGSRARKRIEDVRILRAAQFPEDNGPMSHPIRPEKYAAIDNFYTATVYNKGAEVIRMYETLLGRDGFRKGMDLYFERHDGNAVTCDDFRSAMQARSEKTLPKLMYKIDGAFECIDHCLAWLFQIRAHKSRNAEGLFSIFHFTRQQVNFPASNVDV